MEKTIYIDEKQVKLKSTAALPKRYKAQFGRDYFADLMKVAKVFGKGTKRNFGIQDISFASLDVIQQIKHCLFRHIKTGLL